MLIFCEKCDILPRAVLSTEPVGLKYRHCSAHSHPPDTRRKHCEKLTAACDAEQPPGLKDECFGSVEQFPCSWMVMNMKNPGRQAQGPLVYLSYPRQNNSSLLPYLLVAGCKPSRGADWQWLWSSTKASEAPPYISCHNHWCLKLSILLCWNMWARPRVQEIRSIAGIQQQISRTDNLSYAPIPVSNFLWCCGKKSTSNMMYFSEPQCLKLGQGF